MPPRDSSLSSHHSPSSLGGNLQKTNQRQILNRVQTTYTKFPTGASQLTCPVAGHAKNEVCDCHETRQGMRPWDLVTTYLRIYKRNPEIRAPLRVVRFRWLLNGRRSWSAGGFLRGSAPHRRLGRRLALTRRLIRRSSRYTARVWSSRRCR